MNTLHVTAIATAAVLIVTSGSYAQVRVITPDSEHVYSPDPRASGQLLDDEALQRENARRAKAKAQRQMQQDSERRQEALDADYARRKAEADQAAANDWQARQNQRLRDAGGQDNAAFGARRY
jgi:hypothetical protein